MFATQTADDNGTGIVNVRGNLIYENVEAIKDEILNALTEFKAVIVKIEELEEIDYSFFQLLYAAHKSAEARGKTFSFIPPGEERFMDSLKYSGLLPYTHVSNSIAGAMVFKGAHQ